MPRDVRRDLVITAGGERASQPSAIAAAGLDLRRRLELIASVLIALVLSVGACCGGARWAGCLTEVGAPALYALFGIFVLLGAAVTRFAGA